MKKRSPVPIQLSPDQIRDIASEVFALAETNLDPRFYLLDVAFEKEAGAWYLRLYIEGRSFSVSLNDCEQVSLALDPLIEALAPLRDLPYHLEISSPGLFRPLRTSREFSFYRGHPVRVASEESSAPKGRKKTAAMLKTIAEGFLEAFDADRGTVSLKTPNTAGAPDLLEIPLEERTMVFLNPSIHFPDDASSKSSGNSPDSPALSMEKAELIPDEGV